MIYKDRLQERTAQSALFNKNIFNLIKKLVESLQAKQPERFDVNLKNIVEEKRNVTGTHQVFGKIFETVGFQGIFQFLLCLYIFLLECDIDLFCSYFFYGK